MSHIIPFAGRNHSGSVTQNLLWRDGNVYLMDNHRAALWCWQQHVDLAHTEHSILHVDRHYDTSRANIGEHIAEMPDLSTVGIHEYLNAEVSSLSCKLFRWDNYLSIHLKKYGPHVGELICLTHREGDKPDHSELWEPLHFHAPENLDDWMRGERWIANVDLDFFFCAANGDRTVQAVSDEYIADVFETLRRLNDDGRIAAITICLTPTDFTPGWEECLSMSRRIFAILGAAHPDV